MLLKAAQAILDAERAYKDASDHVTKTCLEIEKDCPHSIWSGKDWSSSDYGAAFDAIYICLHCRMEVHVTHGNYLSHGTPPDNSLVVPLNQIGLKDYTELRIYGDKRGYLTKLYSSFPNWPKREIIEETQHA